MFSTTLEKRGCYCVRVSAQTQNHRIPRMPHALFMCYEKHDWKEGEKQLCSTFTVSHHVKCEEEEEEDESQTQGGRHIPSRLVTGEKVLPTNQPTNQPPPPPPNSPPSLLLSPFSWLEECVKCPRRGTDSKTVFTRSTLSPLLTACEELLPPPLMCQANGGSVRRQSSHMLARQRELIR